MTPRTYHDVPARHAATPLALTRSPATYTALSPAIHVLLTMCAYNILAEETHTAASKARRGTPLKRVICIIALTPVWRRRLNESCSAC